jgi:hypothetical protein
MADDNDVDIKFGANVEGLEEGSERGKAAIEALKEHLDELKESGEQVHEIFETMLEAAGIEIGLDAIKEWIEHSAELGEAMERAGAMLGVTASQASELSGMAKMTGTDFGGLEHTMERFELGLAATGEKTSHVAEALRVLGLSARQFIGVPINQQLAQMAEAFSRFADGPEKTAAAMALLGRAGAEMIPFLDKGKEGMAELHDVLERTGAVMSNDMAAAFAATKDHLNEFSLAWQGLSNKLFDVLRPAIDAAIQGLTSLVEHVDARQIQASVSQLADTLINAASGLERFAIETEDAWQKMVAAISGSVPTIVSDVNTVGTEVAEFLNTVSNLGKLSNQDQALWSTGWANLAHAVGITSDATRDKAIAVAKELCNSGQVGTDAFGSLDEAGTRSRIAIASVDERAKALQATLHGLFATPPQFLGEYGLSAAPSAPKPAVPQMQLGAGGGGKEDHTARDNAEADAKADLEAWAQNAQQKTDLLSKELAEHQITMSQWAGQTKEALGDEAQDVMATYAAELQTAGLTYKQIVDLKTQEAAKLKEIAHQIAEADDKEARTL